VYWGQYGGYVYGAPDSTGILGEPPSLHTARDPFDYGRRLNAGRLASLE